MNRARRAAHVILAGPVTGGQWTEDDITGIIVSGLGWPDTYTEKEASTMKSFHILLTDNSERDVKGADLRVDSVGSLLVVAEGATSDKGPYSVIYAPGTWTMAELERKDDTG